MAVTRIEIGGYYKLKDGKAVYRPLEIVEMVNKLGLWVDTVVYDMNGRWVDRKTISLIEFIKLADMRVKPR